MNYKQFLEQLNSRESSKPPSLEDQLKARIAELAKKFEGRAPHEFNAKVEQVVESHNRVPRHQFAGLSSDEMFRLFYYPLEHGSPVLFRKNIPEAVLDKIGFLRLVEELLKIIKRDGYIKLTAKLGACRDALWLNFMNIISSLIGRSTKAFSRFVSSTIRLLWERTRVRSCTKIPGQTSIDEIRG